MAKTPYRDIPAKLAALEPFSGESMAAAWVDSRYVVISYETEIAEVRWAGEAGVLTRWINPQRYSVTTSRQQNLCRAHLPGTDLPARLA